MTIDTTRTIPLRYGDRIVAAFPFRDKVLVVTEYGDTFHIDIATGWEEDPTKIIIQRV